MIRHASPSIRGPIVGLRRDGLPLYRLYLLSEFSNRLAPAQEMELPDDADAVKWARETRRDSPAELWEANRLVRQWNRNTDQLEQH